MRELRDATVIACAARDLDLGGDEAELVLKIAALPSYAERVARTREKLEAERRPSVLSTAGADDAPPIRQPPTLAKRRR